MGLLKFFSPSQVFSRRNKRGELKILVVAEYDNTAKPPRADLVPFPEPGQRKDAPEPENLTIDEVNALIEKGELQIGY